MTNEQLEKALDDATCSMSIVTVKQGDTYYDVHRYRPGDEVIVSGGTTFQEILWRTSESPELAEWLRSRAIEEARGSNG